MELLKSLFDPSTPRGRVFRTFIQAMLGLSSLAVAITNLQEFRDFLEAIGMLPQLAVFSGWIAGFSKLMHTLEPLYHKAVEWFADQKSSE